MLRRLRSRVKSERSRSHRLLHSADKQTWFETLEQRHLLTTLSLQVDTLSDVSDQIPGDNVCGSGAGTCSLRAAIEESNGHVGDQIVTKTDISFGVSGTINLLSPFQNVIFPVRIVAAPGSITVLAATGQAMNGDGIWITDAAATVDGLEITGFKNGIHIQGPDANEVFRNNIHGNTQNGVFLQNSSDNLIGGVGARNTINDNDANGILVQAGTFNLVRNNEIMRNTQNGVYVQNADATMVGGDSAGQENLIEENDESGVRIEASSFVEVARNRIIGSGQHGVRIMDTPANTIGGATGDSTNVILGSGRLDSNGTPFPSAGIRIEGSDASNNIIENNLIGIDQDDTVSGNNGAGVSIDSPQNVIRGNNISGNGTHGVEIIGLDADGNVVERNNIGVNLTGTSARANGGSGVQIGEGANNIIGSTVANFGNTISGNTGVGVRIEEDPGQGSTSDTTGNIVQGNVIGLAEGGVAALGNGSHGILVAAPGNTIGGTVANAGNLISANNGIGILISGPLASGNVIQRNGIGVDHTQTIARPNVGQFGAGGVAILDASNNMIGGTATDVGNRISGNNGVGVAIVGSAATGNLIQGNSIGEDVNGGPLGNTGHGVFIGSTPGFASASNNTVGGTANGAGNRIARNQGDGVVVESGIGNAVLSNSIALNGLLGIDLGDDGFTANDNLGQDFDTGANNLQNFAEIIGNPQLFLHSIEIAFEVTSSVFDSAYPLTVEFFRVDTDGQEGDGFIGRDQYTSDDALQNKTVQFVAPVPVATGDLIVATATDAAGNTSEFSLPSLPVEPGDCDGDGLTDFDEVDIYGTDPKNVDTDDDDLTDGDEVQIHHTDPLDPDTDDDDLTDGDEISLYGTDPLDEDSDNDSFQDGDEVAAGSDPLDVNDIPDLDFGDAPDPTFSTLKANNGARHIIAGGLFLGTNVDADTDGQPHATATGDDTLDGNDDEDGLTPNSTLVPGQPVSFSLEASAPGLVDAWIDINGDGTWSHPDEQFLASASVVAGNNDFSDLIPADAAFGDTFIRFRISSAGGLAPTGLAADGEVEDYQVTIETVNRFIVNSVGDGGDSNLADDLCNDGSGNCTLRAAIEQANATANLPAGSDVVIFDVPANPILPSSALPPITQAVVIDGTTEPDFMDAPVVEIDGDGAGASANGLYFDGAGSAGSAVRGLVINNFGSAAIRFDKSSGGHTVSGNVLGLDVDGSTEAENRFGLHVSSANNTIEGNVISGNNRGILLNGGGADNNTVRANLIGTNAGGNASRGNVTDGVKIRGGSDNIIGGPAEADGNVISANFTGVAVFGGSADNNTIQHNLIGTKSTGDGNRGNTVGINLIGTPGTTIKDNVVAGSKRQAIRLIKPTTTGTLVENNLIGLDATGTLAIGTTYDGIQIAAPGNTIRGNVIANSGFNGIRLLNSLSTGNVVQGNLIGTALDGTTPMGNALAGILIKNAPGNQIGGSAPGQGNTISANGEHGILIERPGATGNVVEGNQIGTTAAGTAALGNASHGIQIDDGAGNVIGGAAAGAGNVIGGNLITGIAVTGGSVTIQGNFIGTDSGGTLDLGNTGDGIIVNGGTATVGGAGGNGGNTIAHNGTNGVKINTGTGNAIRGNSIHDNAALGIDLKPNGPTDNDPDDPDDGANNLQNFPVIQSAALNGGNLDVQFLVDSATGNSAYDLTVEFFLADPAGEEGQTYLGTVIYPSASATLSFSDSFPIPGGVTVDPDDRIVATATDADGNTSEFSASFTVASMLQAASGEAQRQETRGKSQELTADELLPIVDVAIQRLAASGLDANLLSSIDVSIADLPGATLGLATGNSITIDINAAGYGWFVDATPWEDSDFFKRKSQITNQKSMDLLTVVMHELGHVAGFEDLYDPAYEDDLMYEWLEAGVRRTTLGASLADQALAEI